MGNWLKTRLHVSWIIMVWCGALYAGIVLAACGQMWWTTSIGWVLSASVLTVFACVRQERWVIVLVIIAGGMIGLWRGSSAINELSIYQTLIDKSVVLKGVVTDDSDYDKRGNTILRLRTTEINKRKVEGSVWVVVTQKSDVIRRSDEVVVSGELKEGFGTFSASMYQAKLITVVRSNGVDPALALRDWFASAVRSAISEPAASLGLGFLVGQRRDLPQELETALRITGLTHIIVASGYNLTILVRITRRLFEKLSKYLAASMSYGLIIGFIAITGISPSMSRAGLVTGLALLAWYYGHTFSPFVLLSLAIAITTFINPAYAWGDIGWQLSFAAFAGVLLLAPILQSYFFGNKKPGILRQILGETIAASICTVPILLVSFGYISNIALFANLVVVPLIPLTMLLVFLSGIAVLIAPFIVPLVALPASALLGYMIAVVHLFSGLTWAVTEVVIQPWQAIGMYLVIIFMGVYMWHRSRVDLVRTSVIE